MGSLHGHPALSFRAGRSAFAGVRRDSPDDRAAERGSRRRDGAVANVMSARTTSIGLEAPDHGGAGERIADERRKPNSVDSPPRVARHHGARVEWTLLPATGRFASSTRADSSSESLFSHP